MLSSDGPTLTVGQLKNILAGHPNDREILFRQFSDYAPMTAAYIEVVKAVPNSGWMMRSHPTMSDDNKSKEQTYLLFPGN